MFYISEKNWNKILGYAEEAYDKHKSEIGGLSVMVKDKEGDWELQSPVILKQEISSGNTIIDKDALSVYYSKTGNKMGNKEFRFCWWHSHHTMGAFWSGTDKNTIEEYDDGDFSFALVVNLKGEYKFRVSVWEPVAVHEDVDLEVMRPSRCTKNMSKEVENLCDKISSYQWQGKKAGYNTTYHGYKSSDQVGGTSQERLPFRTTYNQTTLYDQAKMSFHDITSEITDINDEAIDGDIDYKEYSKKVNDLNKILEKQENFYRVTLIPENKLGDLLHMWPNQMVVYESTKDQVLNDYYLDTVY